MTNVSTPREKFQRAYRDMRLGADLDTYDYPSGYSIARGAWESLADRTRVDARPIASRLGQYKDHKAIFGAL